MVLYVFARYQFSSPGVSCFGQHVKLRVLCVGNFVLLVVFVKPVLYVYPYASSLVLVALSGYTLSHLRIKLCLNIRGQPLGR